MISKYKLKCAVVCLVLAVLTGCTKKAPVEIEQLQVMAMPPGQTSAAAYMTLRNNTDSSLVLNYQYSPIAADVEVHRVIYDQGLMQMRRVNHLSIDPGVTLEFKPGGYHLMLMGVDKSLKEGDSFPLTLEFEGGYKITRQVEVKSH